MNIKISHNWLIDFIKTQATPDQIQKYLSLCGPSVETVTKMGDDWIYDIEITTNRVDTASVVGIARELRAILPRYNIAAEKKPDKYSEDISPNEKDLVTIEDKKNLVKRITAICMNNVHVARSPDFISKRLINCDIRSINNVVDISNYVMLTLGHPLHIFDLDKISGNKLIFDNATAGEKFKALDEKTYLLGKNDVVIRDETGKIIDLPGIIGAFDSCVTNQTKKILILIESNNPVRIRETAMTTGIRTYAASINEKFPDHHLSKHALKNALNLLKQFAGAQPSSKIIDINRYSAKQIAISVSLSKINSIIGIEIPEKDVLGILQDLDFKVSSAGQDKIKIIVPSHRENDVKIVEDVVEEVSRIWGYHHLPSKIQQISNPEPLDKVHKLIKNKQKIKRLLKYNGFSEVINYSMISKEDINKCNLDLKDHLKISNSISTEIEYLRISLVPSLLKNLSENRAKSDKLMFFEMANLYKKKDKALPNQNLYLSLITNTDYFALKGIVEAIFRDLKIDNVKFHSLSEQPMLNPKLQCQIKSADHLLGYIGQVKTEVAKNYDLEKAFATQIDFELLTQLSKIFRSFQKPNPYAVVKLDLTIKAESRNYQQLYDLILKSSKFVEKVRLISKMKDNYTFRIFFNDPLKNITENQAKEILKKIENSL